MRIAIIGSGAAGAVSAWLLQDQHQVVLFEAAPRVGGHVHTVKVAGDGPPIPVELGAEFVFEEGYGGLLALIDRFGIPRETDPLAVSMTMEEGRRTIQVPPRSAAALSRLASPRMLRRLAWMLRLAREAEVVADQQDWSVSVQGLMDRARIPRDVADTMLAPLVASCWGVPTDLARELAAFSVVRVMGLRLRHQPHAVFPAGGLGSYLDAVMADAPGVDLRLSTPVTKLDRDAQGLALTAGGQVERFDAAILACDWHNSAAMCAGSPALQAWYQAFAAFEDYRAQVAVHRDLRHMPAHRGLWGAANYQFTLDRKPRTTVWSGRRFRRDLFRSWLREGEAPPASTLFTADYRHIVVTPAHRGRQERLAALQGTAGLHAAGMYTAGVDNHESALRSALRVGQALAPQAPRVAWFARHVSD
ncbi:FAD-dependent oxidoreductase [Myxococcota bacterium]|nr:FAD-dependent oxidoreductase [Myxococcota bacterium]